MKAKRKRNVGLFSAIGILIVIITTLIIHNFFNADYEKLNQTDQKILSEIDAYMKANAQKPIWEDFNLDKNTVLALDGSFGKGYLINPHKHVNRLFAKKIRMPDDYSITVYRITCIAPQLLQFRLPGNFNTIGKTYKVFGNEVYYTKYETMLSMEKKFSSRHYITFLSHESFHYYMQEKWAGGGRFSMDSLTKDDLELLGKEYVVLGKIQKMLLTNEIDKGELLQYAKEYRDIVKQRISANPTYLKDELSMETSEGTATYVGIKASEMVEYDFGVMYFDNKKNVPITEVMPNVEAGHFNKSFLADRMPYETGALLCMLLDALEISEWQEMLNSQTLENPVTLFNILETFSEAN